MIDLASKLVDIIVRCVTATLPSATIYLYGSRATGRARRNSDVDLCVRADRAATFAEMEAIREALSVSDLPYLYDVCDWHALDPAFRQRIKPTWVLLWPT